LSRLPFHRAAVVVTLFISVVLRTHAAEGHDTITADAYGTILSAPLCGLLVGAVSVACFLYGRCCAEVAMDKEQEKATADDGLATTDGDAKLVGS
jgi:hypothetical protein